MGYRDDFAREPTRTELLEEIAILRAANESFGQKAQKEIHMDENKPSAQGMALEPTDSHHLMMAVGDLEKIISGITSRELLSKPSWTGGEVADQICLLMKARIRLQQIADDRRKQI